MNTKILVLLSMLSMAAPAACVVHTTAPRDVGSVAADGSVYLGWHLLSRDKRTNASDHETYDVGAQLGGFTAIRLHAEKPTAIAQVLVIFANGERFVAQAPPGLAADEWSAPLPLPGGPRAIHSIVVSGAPASSLLAKVEIHGYR